MSKLPGAARTHKSRLDWCGLINVCYGPDSDQNSALQRNDATCHKRTHAPQQTVSLFDHFVGGDQKTRWHGKTDRLCCFQVENHFVLGGSLRR